MVNFFWLQGAVMDGDRNQVIVMKISYDSTQLFTDGGVLGIKNYVHFFLDFE